MSDRYTLHFGLTLDHDLPSEILIGLGHGDLVRKVVECHSDGDSFLQWGEEPEVGERTHGQIVFTAESYEDARADGIHLALKLVESRRATLFATCHSDFHVPFAITQEADWSKKIL